MPSGQEGTSLQRTTYQQSEQQKTILHTVKEQGAHFQQFSREVEAQHQGVTAHLERFKIRDPEDGSATYPENPYIWQPTQINSIIPEDPEFETKMTEPHLHYYPDHGSNLPDYLQEGIPDVQESYSMSYETSTSTNGHHGDGDASSNNSQSSVPVDNASLISRSTSQTKTQQVKTVTKIIKTREVHHIGGADGKPIAYSPYGTTLPPGSDYLPYNYGNPAKQNVPHDYGTYDPGRPPSPAGQTPTQVYHSTYGQPYSEYGYREYPPHQNVTTPQSIASDSPNLHRAMPQAPRVAADFNQSLTHTSGNYEDIDATLVPPRGIDYRRTPSPTQSADRDIYSKTYGYSAQSLPATSPGYHEYDGHDTGLPEGYLDRRPSYDEHPPAHTRLSQSQFSTSTYAHPPRPHTGYAEEPLPLPPNDEAVRHNLGYDSADNQGSAVHWRDPDLPEVIQFLGYPNNLVRANAAAYLAHLCYMDDCMKAKTRSLGGIPPLIQLLSQDIPEIQRNALSALRNLSYGRKNDENKRCIKSCDGIPALVRLLRKSADNQIIELVTGILWNLSSCEDLKHPILDDALLVLVNHVIIPHSGYSRNIRNILEETTKPGDVYFSTVYRNASGVLRNVSSAGEYARKKLRTCEGLVEAVIFLVRSAIGRNDTDCKAVENSVCLLRNLSYRCEEVENDYGERERDTHKKKVYPEVQQSRATAPIKAVGDHLGCFGATKKKKEAAQAAEKLRREGVPLTKNPISQSDPVTGMALLWQPEVAKCYLALLGECSNPETIEGAAGALQNLTACYWAPSVDIRATVRREKGLPVLVELLRMEVDTIVCVVATALRNLSQDSRNRDLIGNYALKDLVQKLPNGSPQHDAGTSNDTIAAVLATLNEVVAKQSVFAQSLLQLGGVDRLNKITQQKNNYSPRVVKFASQLLYNMWLHADLRDAYKKAGWKESHFVPKGSLAVRNSLSSPTQGGPLSSASTLNRPVSSLGGTKYEDRTLPHGTELNSTDATIPYSRSEELPLSELSHSSEPPLQSQVHNRPHMGVFPPGMEQARSHTPAEPVYAQVDRHKKKGRQHTHSDLPKVQLLSNEPDGMPAGDSWV